MSRSNTHHPKSAITISTAWTLVFCLFATPSLAVDSDGDGMDDAWEIANFGNITVSNGTGDFDGDGLSDLAEYQNNTNPKVKDTDGDGFSDYIEAINGVSPTNPQQFPVPPYKEWVRMTGSAAWDENNRTWVDPLTTNIYLVGDTFGAFNGQTNKGGQDYYVCKYSSDGVLLWTRIDGNSSDQRACSVVTDTNGYVYVGGETRGSLHGCTNAGDWDIFLVKYTSEGTRLWTKMLGSSAFDGGGGVAMDKEGRLFIGGYTLGAFDGQTNAQPGHPNAFLCRLTTDGDRLWTRIWGCAAGNSAGGIDFGASNIYVGGNAFGSYDGQTNVCEGTADLCLSKFDYDGNRLWTRIWGSASNDDGGTITVDYKENIYVQGSTYGSYHGQTNAGGLDACVSKFDSNGNRIWTRIWGTTNYDCAGEVHADHGLLVSGASYGSFDGQTNRGSCDNFLTRMTLDGNRHWTRFWGGASFDTPKGGGGQESSGNLFIGGGSRGSYDFATNVAPPNEDICLTKWIVNRLPVAKLSASPTNGYALLRVTLDLSGSFDPDSDIVGWQLDKDGDGTFDTSGEQLGQVVVEYPKPGIYIPRLRVVDDFGAWSEANTTVVVSGTPPTAVISADKTNGVAPLTVCFNGTNSTAATGRTIVAYEWDMDGDGESDISSTNSSAIWVYREVGTKTAVLRVTDDEGRSGSDSLLVTVTSATNPPQVTLHVAPDTGYVPLMVVFTATATDDGVITAYEWDFDGDGRVDLVTQGNTATNTYEKVGSFKAMVRVVDDTGLDATAIESVFVTEASNLKVWLSVPKDGWHVWGSEVSVHANTAPGNMTASLQLQYKLSSTNIWNDLGAIFTPPPFSFKTTWAVTSLVDMAQYDLRAVAVDTYGAPVTSEVIRVVIDSAIGKKVGDVSEGQEDGKHKKQQTISESESAKVNVYDGTSVEIPLGAVSSNITVSIELTGASTNTSNGSASGKQNINANRKVAVDGDPDLSKVVTIDMPYSDDNDDGIVDGTTVRETQLEGQWFDPVKGKWVRALSTEVHTKENFVRVQNYHLTEFGLFGHMNLLTPEAGGILASEPVAYTNTTGGSNLTDSSLSSYWRSAVNPMTNQIFIYTFTNYMGGVIDRASICNFGQVSEGKTNFSQGFSIQASMDGTNYQTLADGTLLATEVLQDFSFSAVTCRWVRLVISSGVSPDSWDLAEFGVYGTLTADADGDQMADSWEVQYFGQFGRDGTEDLDGDGLCDRDEYRAGSNPTNKDTDGDGLNDYAESVAGTDPNSNMSLLAMSIPSNQVSEAITGLVICWASVAGKEYVLQRSTNLLIGFSWENSNLTAFPPLNTYTDSTATGISPYFYRIKVKQ